MIADKESFIKDNTRLQAPPLCPEIQLHLADELVPIWSATEAELGALGLPPPFWAFAWAGGQALARYILDNPMLVQGRCVLDVASGSGLVAIAAKLVGASRVVAVDIDPFAVTAIQLNAISNAVSLVIAEADVQNLSVGEEVILVGDLFYDRDLSPTLLHWLQKLGAAGATVRVGDPGRSYFPKSSFTQEAEYRVPTTRLLEDAEIKRTGVWRFVVAP